MRVDARAVSRYPWYLRPFFWNQRRKYGAVLDAALLWGRAPRLFLGVATLYGMIDRSTSPIDPALRSLLTVRVSQINHCPFCVDLNSATLMKRGASEAKVDALAGWRESTLFDARERAALDYAEAMTYPNRGVDDSVMTCLKQHFDDDAVVELTGLIAFQNLSSKFNSALDVAPQGFCRAQERVVALQDAVSAGESPGGAARPAPVWRGADLRLSARLGREASAGSWSLLRGGSGQRIAAAAMARHRKTSV